MTNYINAFIDLTRFSTPKHRTMPTLRSDSRSYYHLGDVEERSMHPIRGVFVQGPYKSIGKFEAMEEYYDFVVDTSQIRACSDYIHQTYHDGNMTEQEHDHRYRNEFLPMIDRFKGKWGSKMVPEDIRAAVGGVERGVGVPITVWPEWVYAR